jgi:hypothetical protein
MPGDLTGPPVLGGHKYGDLTLQVGGVWNETVKYVREFCGTSSRVTTLETPRRNYTSKLQTHPLVREGAHQEICNSKAEKKSGHWLQLGARHQDRLADWIGRKFTSASTSRAAPDQLTTIIGLLDYWSFGVELQFSSLLVKSCCGWGTVSVREERKGNFRRCKSLPKNLWRHSRPRRLAASCSEV